MYTFPHFLSWVVVSSILSNFLASDGLITLTDKGMEIAERIYNRHKILTQFFISIGMPRNFAELGAKEEDIPVLVQALCRGDGRPGTISGFVTLDEDDCTKIYQMMV